MTETGTLVYDPVHRVSHKQEVATKRTMSSLGVGHLARLIGSKHLAGKTLRGAKRALADLSEDPHQWTRLGKGQANSKQVHRLYGLLENIQQATSDDDLAEFLNQVESRMVKTKTRDWTAIVKVNPRVTSPHLRNIRAQGTAISQPAWGPHITVVRGEAPSRGFGQHWGAGDGSTIEFEITSEPRKNKKGHWWLDITSPTLEKIRTDLGLNPNPRIPFHLTIGKEQ